MIRNKGILIFTGFIFSMIFSHADIILPAITKLTVKLYRPFLYVWFGLLQLSLIIRIVADLFEDVLCRRIGGFANGVSILLFFVSILIIMKLELVKMKRLRIKTSLTSLAVLYNYSVRWSLISCKKIKICLIDAFNNLNL